MKPIYLIGFMGCGKTSTAKELACSLEVESIDTDTEIETVTGSSIPVLFSEKGETYFRQKETEVLLNQPLSNCVIATGGGIIGKEENRRWMRRNGFVVYLDTSWQQIVKRLGNDPSRPLWKGKDKKNLFDLRIPIYNQTAHLVIFTDNKSPKDVAKEILLHIKQNEKDYI